MEYSEQEILAWRQYYSSIVNGLFSSYNMMASQQAIEAAADYADYMIEQDKKRFNKNTTNTAINY